MDLSFGAGIKLVEFGFVLYFLFGVGVTARLFILLTSVLSGSTHLYIP